VSTVDIEVEIMQKLLKDKSVDDIILTVVDGNLPKKRENYYVLCSEPSQKVRNLTAKSELFTIIKALQIIQEPKTFREIIGSGKSLKLKKKICKQLGVEKYYSFEYSLQNLESTKKQIFSHALHGTGGRKSYLKKVNGKKLGKNNILVPIEKSQDITEFFSTWDVKYNKRVIWLENEKIK